MPACATGGLWHVSLGKFGGAAEVRDRLRYFPHICALFVALTLGLAPAYAQSVAQDVELPIASGRPFDIDVGDDPILAMSRDSVAVERFRTAVAQAVAASPVAAEALAMTVEAEAARREAKSALFPVIDLGISGSQSIARKFSNDPNLIVERSRPARRFDATAAVQQTLYDFGAARRRVEAASSRIVAATADADQKTAAVALRAIGSWYDVFAYDTLSRLGRTYLTNQQDLRSAVDARIRQGVSARVERARVDSAIASAELRLAQFNRALSNAQARYAEIFKASPDDELGRAPPPTGAWQSRDAVIARAKKSPAVKSAQALAKAAEADARAARADTLPTVSAGIDAGRYGILENGREDYDVRARIAIRQHLLGPGVARKDQAFARADAQRARALAVEDEAVREANIAWSDVEALHDMMPSYQANYLSARMTRDAVVERFRVSRGTLFDVLDAEDRFFDAAANYIRALSEYDSARYVLLARSGQLLEVLEILPAAGQPKR